MRGERKSHTTSVATGRALPIHPMGKRLWLCVTITDTPPPPHTPHSRTHTGRTHTPPHTHAAAHTHPRERGGTGLRDGPLRSEIDTLRASWHERVRPRDAPRHTGSGAHTVRARDAGGCCSTGNNPQRGHGHAAGLIDSAHARTKHTCPHTHTRARHTHTQAWHTTTARELFSDPTCPQMHARMRASELAWS